MGKKEPRSADEALLGHQEEISKDMLVIVLIVIIFVSILGTWTILSTLDKVPKPGGMTVIKEPVTGKVSLNIVGKEVSENMMGSDG